MSHDARLEFIAEGLPIVFGSMQGFSDASRGLTDRPREAAVLEGFALEEAAKVLILMDVVRCPRALVSGHLSKMLGWFYDHLARLIYCEACEIRSTDVNYLRDAVEHRRKSHYVEGNVGEYILPNSLIYRRESHLYADIEAYDDGEPFWSRPHVDECLFFRSEQNAIKIVKAMAAVGMFGPNALKIVSDVWNDLAFENTQDHQDASRMVGETLERLLKADLVPPGAEQHDADILVSEWQLPMYALNLQPILVSRAELEEEQTRLLWSEAGY